MPCQFLFVIILPTIENGEEVCILVFLFLSFFCFFFIFHAKSGTTNNHRNGSTDILYQSLFMCDLNDL